MPEIAVPFEVLMQLRTNIQNTMSNVDTSMTTWKNQAAAAAGEWRDQVFTVFQDVDAAREKMHQSGQQLLAAIDQGVMTAVSSGQQAQSASKAAFA